MQRAIEVRAGFLMDRDQIRAGLHEGGGELVGIANHEVAVELQLRDFAEGFDDRRSEGDVGDEVAVHHIDVEHRDACGFDLLDVVGKAGEVRCEDGGEDFHGVLRMLHDGMRLPLDGNIPAPPLALKKGLSLGHMALLHFWKSSREVVLSQTIQQVVSNAGDGSLRDGNTGSLELREFLTHVPVDSLFSYVRQCLDTPSSQRGFVLQDLVNELGRRLDFDVENGLYQGKRNAIGFDGLWKAQGEPELVVEVKSTDTYTISLETAIDYRDALVAEGKVSKSASILIVVGREDTGALEAQIRGSRHAWDIRLISVESFIKLVQVRAKSDDPSTVRQIHQLLRPFEYTKVDKIIEILFRTAQDVENHQEEERLELVAQAKRVGEASPMQSQEKTPQSLLEEMRDRAVKGFAKLRWVDLVKRGRSYYWNGERTFESAVLFRSATS